MEPNNGASQTNTILIVIVIIILVALGVWWFTTSRGVSAPEDNSGGINVDLNFPGGDGDAGGSEAEGRIYQ